ncbi:MAG: zinc-dependent metalloprotease [Nocardioides sp.]|jgi:putative hydrolase
MSNNPGDDDSPERGPDDNNPFKGTPFEGLFGPGGMGAGGQMPDLSAILGALGAPGAPGAQFDLGKLFAQMQSMMQPHDGPVNWDAALDMARKQIKQPDPSVSASAQADVADALRLADHWLDTATDFPSGITSSTAWSRAEWLVNTADVWKVLVEPVAASATDALGDALPEEARAMAGPLLGMIKQASGGMVAGQVGAGLGALAGEVLGACEIGIPLGAPGRAALVPANVAEFAADLDDVTEEDVRLYLALREAAHQRLFAGVPWLRDHLIGAIRDYATGSQINTSAIEDKMRGLDMSNPAAMQEMLSGGMFDLEDSPAQQAALGRIEVTLALIEGWVDEVVSQATAERMPAATKLQEAVRRRRAAGGPAEETFASLVGLELRPRRLREASTLWGSLRTRQGAEARDGVWMSPHLLPTAEDLDDPLGFREGATAIDSLSDADFEAGLNAILDEGMGGASGPEVPKE